MPRHPGPLAKRLQVIEPYAGHSPGLAVLTTLEAQILAELRRYCVKSGEIGKTAYCAFAASRCHLTDDERLDVVDGNGREPSPLRSLTSHWHARDHPDLAFRTMRVGDAQSHVASKSASDGLVVRPGRQLGELVARALPLHRDHSTVADVAGVAVAGKPVFDVDRVDIVVEFRRPQWKSDQIDIAEPGTVTHSPRNNVTLRLVKKLRRDFAESHCDDLAGPPSPVRREAAEQVHSLPDVFLAVRELQHVDTARIRRVDGQ